MIRDRKDIPMFAGVSDADWSDWHWQMRNRLTTLEDFTALLDLDEAQRADLELCLGRFRVSVTPYYASLIDPDDPHDPVRAQAVATPAELVVHSEEMKDSIAEDFDSPTPHLTHRYPDRVLFVVTDMCSMYCRHCTRRRLVGGSEKMVSREDIDNAIKYIERSPEVRDVLISGGDPLVLSDNQLEDIISRVRAIEHVEIIRLGSRMPVVCPQRITPELCAMLKKYHPLYFNTHFNHPNEFTPESKAACDMLADAGINLGNQSVLLRGVNDCSQRHDEAGAQAAAVPRAAVLLLPVRPLRGHGALPHQRDEGHRDLREPARPHRVASPCPPSSSTRSAAAARRRCSPTTSSHTPRTRSILRNYEGVISRYDEPDDYGKGECHCPDCESAAPAARRGRHVRRGARTRAQRRVGGAHAEGRRPQEPHGRRVRRGRGLRRRCPRGWIKVKPGVSKAPRG